MMSLINFKLIYMRYILFWISRIDCCCFFTKTENFKLHNFETIRLIKFIYRVKTISRNSIKN